MKRLFALFLFCFGLFSFAIVPVRAARYSTDETLYKLNFGDEIKSNNGLIFSPVFDLSGQYPNVQYQVMDGRPGKNDMFLGTTSTYTIGDKVIVKFAGVSVELWTYNTGVLDGEPWVEVRVKSLVSADVFTVSNVQHLDLKFRYPLTAPSVSFNASIPVTQPKIIYCKASANCSNPTEAQGNNFFSTNHVVTLGKGLENNTMYYYKIQATTEAGEVATADNGGSWYMLQTVSAPVAVIQNLKVTAGDTAITLYFETPDNSYATIDYGVSAITEHQKIMNAYGKELIILLDGLEKGVTYKYRITLQKADDLTSYSQSSEMTFTTKANLVQFSGIVEMTAPTSANITWNTDLECQGEVWYRIKGTQTHTIVKEEQYLKAHWGRIIDLLPATTYEYRLGCLIINDIRKAQYPDDGSPWLEFVTTSTPPIATPDPIVKNDDPSVDERIERLNIQISTIERTVLDKETSLTARVDQQLVNRLKGKIVLQVEERGEAWYVDPTTGYRYYMRDGVRAYDFLRAFGLGISNPHLSQIPIGIETRADMTDSDNDGVDDRLEDALGTKNSTSDTDADGFSDYEEIISGYNPNGPGKTFLTDLGNSLEGKILLQVESRGEAWYVHNGKRYYMKDGAAAYQIMRYLSLGISNTDLRKIEVGQF